MKYVLLRSAAHMPKEERLRTRHRKVTAFRRYPQDQGTTRSQHSRQGVESLQKAFEWIQSHVTVSYDKRGNLGHVGVIEPARALAQADRGTCPGVGL